MRHFKIYSTLIIIFTLSLLLTACGDIISAISIRLRKTEGDVLISDDSDKDVEIMDDLLLFSGYKVQTRPESFAWLDFDSVKLGKLDESSKIEVEKDGGALKVDILSGNLFFHVTEPLGDDESMEIRTSTLAVGIRGTCGWVEVPEGGDSSRIYLLEGKVECSAGDESVTVSAGEMAFVTGEGGITVEKFDAGAIPDFVRDEAGDDDNLEQMIQEIPGQTDTEESKASDEGDGLPFSEPIDNFVFASGAGGWSVGLVMYPDGTFNGSYHDSDMGDTGPGYDGGTVYICEFSGKFTNIRKVDEYTYSMTLEYYDTVEPVGKEWISEQVKFVAAGPYGIEGGTTFELYLPGKPVASLSEEFISWSAGLTRGEYFPQNNGQPSVSNLKTYGLYNVEEGNGFYQY